MLGHVIAILVGVIIGLPALYLVDYRRLRVDRLARDARADAQAVAAAVKADAASTVADVRSAL